MGPTHQLTSLTMEITTPLLGVFAHPFQKCESSQVIWDLWLIYSLFQNIGYKKNINSKWLGIKQTTSLSSSCSSPSSQHLRAWSSEFYCIGTPLGPPVGICHGCFVRFPSKHISKNWDVFGSLVSVFHWYQSNRTKTSKNTNTNTNGIHVHEPPRPTWICPFEA